MSKRTKGGWKVIKTISGDDVKAIRARELQTAAESHKLAGEKSWANHYAKRAAEIVKG